LGVPFTADKEDSMAIRFVDRLDSILRQQCPKCREGRMFKGIFHMEKECGVCHLKFEREEGYWTGAMMVNWVMVCVIFGPLWGVMIAKGVPFPITCLVTLALLAVLLPFLFRYSRVLWLHLDHSVDTGEKRP